MDLMQVAYLEQLEISLAGATGSVGASELSDEQIQKLLVACRRVVLELLRD